mmetsp:Transcript_27856/g.52510  ORF Transcript_27856/g.52510 Transcript_27856/m.52510 type:complete len:539 (+) Transcript_27856:157-1773(+)|eukprot:CAMPEP_0201671622 /NCGR_PEP_ID=MMETSP0494-20130426/30173_1 /ASSEMBLY_ACC=CAM_ASM_000839 /TAXON_ID=420259 /ORGANISM="Thalassiosira gravida, Strain GMp14c1" /LENGTH=538 /DNA_ID=CAMNT_0048153039 /DNA_START=131 /DNA_END=1747 /DNA_ORIENTATION=+
MHLASFSAALSAALTCTILPSTSGFAPIESVGRRRGVHQQQQHVNNKIQPLHGIMDEVNSDAFDLSSLLKNDDDDSGGDDMDKAYEMFLGQLVFSSNDPRIDIMDNYDLCADPEWLTWLERKIATTRDVEEKMALSDLSDMIVDVKKRVELSREAEERAASEATDAEKNRIANAEADMEEGRALSGTDLLKRAAKLDTAGVDAMVKEQAQDAVKQTFYETDLTPEIRKSYEDMCSKVLPPYKAGDTPASVVFNNYEQFDAQFIKVLNERAMNGDADSQSILDALSVEQQTRVNVATMNIKEVLSKGEPMRMEGAIVKLAKEGKIDEPFLLLLEANADQARAAGAIGPAELMTKLRQRAITEKDKQSTTKEIKLLRQLLREPNSNEREKLLEEAFTPKEALIVPGTTANAQKAIDGEAPEDEKPMPEVPPPDFINCCKAVMLNFGNLNIDEERGDLAVQIKIIASEAEVVATRIYGKGMSVREQQDRAWKEQTTSIFDLETLEIEAERRGETAPWANANGGDELLPGFGMDGKMSVGGN